MLTRLIVIIPFILILSGCGGYYYQRDIIDNLNGDLKIFINANSEPQGAKIFVNEQFNGNTPSRLTVNGKWSSEVTIRRTFHVQGNKEEMVGAPEFPIPVKYNINLSSIKVTIYKEGYRPQDKILPIYQDFMANCPDCRGICGCDGANLMLNYSWTAFLEKGPDIDLRLKIRP